MKMILEVLAPQSAESQSAPVQSSDPKVAVTQRIRAAIKLTTTTNDRSDIPSAGDVVEIHRPGLLMYGLASPIPPANAYKNGTITQGWSNFGRGLLGGMLPGGQTPENYPQRKFMPGEKLWVTQVEVQKDGVIFQLYSDPYDDIRYYGDLKIPFPNKNEIPSADAALQLVAEVLTVVPPDNQEAQPTDQGAQQAPAPSPAQDSPPPPIAGQYLAPGGSHMLLLTDGTFTKFVGGGQGHGQYAVDGNNLTLTFASTGFAQHFKVQGGNLVDVNTQQAWARTGDAPLPDIAPPPPPPADTPPPTIALGQTMDQVTVGFGQPLRLAKVGTKTIFYYKDMKVTFTNGKVSNVE